MNLLKQIGDYATESGRVALPQVAVSFAALATVTAATVADNWTHYSDPRFGAAVDVPPGFSAGEPPADDGGLEFTGADGRARIAIYGLFNVESQRLKEYSAFSMEKETEAGWQITYNRTSSSWFVHSGRNRDRIFYEKTILACDSSIVNSVWIEYPSSLKTRFDPIVERISASLRHEKAYECR